MAMLHYPTTLVREKFWHKWHLVVTTRKPPTPDISTSYTACHRYYGDGEVEFADVSTIAAEDICWKCLKPMWATNEAKDN